MSLSLLLDAGLREVKKDLRESDRRAADAETTLAAAEEAVRGSILRAGASGRSLDAMVGGASLDAMYK